MKRAGYEVKTVRGGGISFRLTGQGPVSYTHLLAPIPFATVPNRETGHMGQNYFRSLFAVGFQGLLILVCVAIYAVLIQSIATDGDPIGAIWGCVGYTVLLCFTLFKTGSPVSYTHLTSTSGYTATCTIHNSICWHISGYRRNQAT